MAAAADDTRAQADADRPSPARPGKAGAVCIDHEAINQFASVSTHITAGWLVSGGLGPRHAAKKWKIAR
jgi:hypothetical protein